MLFRRQHQTQTVGGSHLAFPGGGRMGHIWQGPVVGHSLAEDNLWQRTKRHFQKKYFEYSAWSDKQTGVMIIVCCKNPGPLSKYIYCAILREKDDSKGKKYLPSVSLSIILF